MSHALCHCFRDTGKEVETLEYVNDFSNLAYFVSLFHISLYKEYI